MDTYDALGKRPERYSTFTEGLLAEAEDTEDCVSALERVLAKDTSTARLSDILNAAQDLSRWNCRDVGGAPLPVLSNDPLPATPQTLAVGLLSSCLTLIARQ
jgi:hypothetical protein